MTILTSSDYFPALSVLFPLLLIGHVVTYQGRIQDFKLGGAHLKKLRRAEEGAKFFLVFRVRIRDFTRKKQITESLSTPNLQF